MQKTKVIWKYPNIQRAVNESDKKLAAILKTLGLTYYQFYCRVTGRTEIKFKEWKRFSKYFGESVDYLSKESSP